MKNLRLILRIDFLNSFLYVSDGKTNIIKLRAAGTNEIKYPNKKSHGSRADFIQVERNVMIRRGKTNDAKIHGEIRRCLCC